MTERERMNAELGYRRVVTLVKALEAELREKDERIAERDKQIGILVAHECNAVALEASLRALLADNMSARALARALLFSNWSEPSVKERKA